MAMDPSPASADVANSVSEVLLMARESLVLLTVMVIVGVAYFIWMRIFKPFMEYQQKITEAHANALNAIQNTARELNDVATQHKEAAQSIQHSANTLRETQDTVLASIRALRAAG